MEEEKLYCHECGGDNLAYKDQYACGEHWICRDCEKEICHTPIKLPE